MFEDYVAGLLLLAAGWAAVRHSRHALTLWVVA